MFKKGEIVYHDNLIFCNGKKDKKKYRPCVVLFEFFINDIGYVCTVPITSSIKSFNKHDCFILLSQILYSYKKLNFAEINNLLLNPSIETHRTNIVLNKRDLEVILKKVSNYNYNSMQETILKNTLTTQAKTKKLLKKNKE